MLRELGNIVADHAAGRKLGNLYNGRRMSSEANVAVAAGARELGI